ncbi:MAG: class I SAM-dependent methyltransferase [Bacillota bacterium]|nr:class I SAM-dependent methyltransferase [Bacillota bacterium]MDW7685267.1 class I SAM-dependent methyltransferase [Bacillota bacterium]
MQECILCGSREVDNVDPVSPLIYLHCPQCDLIFLEEDFRLAPEDEKKHYETHENTLDNPGYVQLFEKFIAGAVRPYIDGGRALDYGSGPGPVLKVLLERSGFSAETYDPFFAPQSPQGSFDLVTCTEVMEHVYTPREMLGKLCSLLPEGGVLALMTHFHPGREAFPRWWYHKDPTHVTFFSAQTFRWIAENLPLQMLYSDGENTVTFRKGPNQK